MKTVVRLIFLLILAAVAVLAINLWVLFCPKGTVYREISRVPQKQTAIILGAQVINNTFLSRTLKDRVLMGIMLYRAGKVKKILVSGDHGRLSYDEVNTMRRFILKMGVPAKDVFMDHAGFDTYDSIYRARAIFEVKSAIIVSQAFHLPRALYIAKGLRVDAVGVVAEQKYSDLGAERRGEKREVLARIKAFGEVLLHRRPKYLGEAIPISGDGRATMDQLD